MPKGRLAGGSVKPTQAGCWKPLRVRNSAQCLVVGKELAKSKKALRVQAYPKGFNITSFGEEYEKALYPIIASDESDYSISLLLFEEKVKSFVQLAYHLGVFYPILLILTEVGEGR